jgi:hypothetical protein
VYNGDHPVTPKWAIHLEGEWRRTPFLVQPEQRLLKTGVQRKFGVGWTALIGYTYVVNAPPDDSTRVFGTESRHALFQQVANKQKFRSLQLSQWVRLANTFASLRAKDQTITWSFRQRVQYHGAVEIPAFGRRLPFAPSYYPIYDEVTLSIHPSPDHEILTQNRVYAALGWKIGEFEAVELGYMHQFRPVSNGIVARHNDSLQVTVHSARPFTGFLSKHRHSLN